MRLLVSLGHPAHFHLLKHCVAALEAKGHEVRVLIRNKDVLQSLVEGSGWSYVDAEPASPASSRLVARSRFASRWIRSLREAFAFRPDMVIGSTVETAHAGRLLGVPSILLFEDDLEVVPQWARLVGPFATVLVCPSSCSPGRWAAKTVTYDGLHELAYLTPAYFTPDETRVPQAFSGAKRNFILRFARLSAYHDEGKSGISAAIAGRLIDQLSPHGTVHITSEREIEPELAGYRLAIDPADIHHALYYADLYIGDSQTMALEAAVLGTPSVRFNDFVGRLGCLEELEHRYGLTFGVRTGEPEKLYARVDQLLAAPDLKEEWRRRRRRLLAETIEVTPFLTWLIEDYPQSVREARDQEAVRRRFGKPLG